ncbi:hypothetical protein [Bifidobacterium sp.]|jgi:hypothetical protein|uniref:hypothetical protein n=1 Tax=Bifidobacterium sp. TaxID=41200 RepID=UPI0025C45650|nr:hypothetical protein [Bifidobacterium sp.]MCH4209383.1 hypothetical protein [Bifidobacterium sp.]MCI1225141.1 hypothetical protein [Bifidobacterium sp.]
MSKRISTQDEPLKRTVSSFRSSALDIFISEKMSSEFTEQYSESFTTSLQNANSTCSKAEVIAEAYATILGMHDRVANTGNGMDEDAGRSGTDHTCLLLARRWNEWFNAEKRGLIIYENQNDASAQTHVYNDKFDKRFKLYADQYGGLLIDKYAVLLKQKQGKSFDQEKMHLADVRRSFMNPRPRSERQ